MAEYNSVGSFGGVLWGLSDITPTQQPSTLKSNIGKTFIEKQIPMRNAVDTILQISGVITGLSTSIEADRAALIALEDGFKHAYSDGRHSFDAVIVPGSLSWPDEANREQGQPYKFSMTLIEWGS